jgi:hypothetical protein
MHATAKKLLFSSAVAATAAFAKAAGEMAAASPASPVDTPAPIKVRNNAKLAPVYLAALRLPKAHSAGADGQWKEC